METVLPMLSSRNFVRKTAAPLAFLASFAGVSPAFAHAFLKHSVPAAGSTVKMPPPALLLAYTEDLEVPFCTVTVISAAGAAVQTAKPQPVTGHRDEISVPIHITKPGRYTVSWHALSVDTHKTQGRFNFIVSY